MTTLTNPQPVSTGAESFDFENFSFGSTPTDHLFFADYDNGSWGNPRIEKFGNLSLSPFSLCFHYGQTVFEGMKAYRISDETINIFRPDRHLARMNRSLERMCMPAIPNELFLAGLEAIVKADYQWLPNGNDKLALYIRPFVIATEPRLGVKVSDQFLFCIACTPITQYYDKPLRVKVETKFSRSFQGGAGYAKCGGNYGGAFYPTYLANQQGFDQIIWTDASTHQFLEEAGTMNIMVIADGKLLTPPLSSSILDGVTRSSLIQLCGDLGIFVDERQIRAAELAEALVRDENAEVFGTGTAAVVSPVTSIQIDGVDYHPYTGDQAVMYRLKNELEEIRRGRKRDTHGWNYLVHI